jgi:hypothetical protein
MSSRDITLFIDPFSRHFVRDRLFDPSIEKFNGDNILAPWLYLRDWFTGRGVEVHTADYLLEGKFCKAKNVFVSFGLRERCQAAARRPDVVLSAFFAFESPTVEPGLYRGLANVQRCFKRVFTFCDSDSLRPFLAAPLKSEIFQIPSPLDSEREDLWSRGDRKFLVMINHNRLPANTYHELYTERMRAIEFFARTGEIDLYGRGWNVPSFKPYTLPVPGTLQHAHRFLIKQWQRIRPVPALQAARTVWKGPIPSKLEGLSRYDFSICFDNVILNGWITEKIFDCFAAGNIPVYWGAPDIEKHVPPECFIDMRKFANYEELRRYLKSLGPKEIQIYRENGRAYLRSEKFKPFTKQVFAERLARLVEEDTGVRL